MPHDDDNPEIADPRGARNVELVEERLALDEALEQLSDELRSAVVLRDVVDLDYQEIADTLDIPVGTVKSRIARGRAALASQLRIEELPELDGNHDGGSERQNGST